MRGINWIWRYPSEAEHRPTLVLSQNVSQNHRAEYSMMRAPCEESCSGNMLCAQLQARSSELQTRVIRESKRVFTITAAVGVSAKARQVFRCVGDCVSVVFVCTCT